MKHLAITCGGTGGHFYPGLSIAREYQKQGGEVVLLLSGIHAEAQQQTAQRYGIAAELLPRMPSPRRAPLQFLKGLLGGYLRARKLLKEKQSDVLLGMGSFASLPAVLGAWRGKIPVYLHDGNARIGKANRILSRGARFLGTAFPAVNVQDCHAPAEAVGMPVRPELAQYAHVERGEAIAALNKLFSVSLDPALPVILIFGGSQGAAIFNRVLPEALLECGKQERFQVLHLTGRGKLEETLKIYEKAEFPHLVLESSEEMHLFLGAADAVFCRSGGSTVAELALFGKAAVLVPYPYAAEGHQADNAAFLTGADAAVSVRDSEFNGEKARELLLDFLHNTALWRARAERARALAKPQAALDMLRRMECLPENPV